MAMTSLSSFTTMRMLGVRLRLSTMTISRALRNAAGVSAVTRKRVLQAARQMSYRPDPALAVLNRYRHARRSAAIRERIAFITNFSTPDGWKTSLTFVRYFEGIRRRSLQLGYEVDPFWLTAPGLNSRRASQILHERGVRGVIIGPLAAGETRLELEWDLFSAVSVGRSLVSPALSAVSIDHVQVVELAWREVVRRGYQRIGLAVTHGEDVRTAGGLRASFLLQQERSELPRLPVFCAHRFSKSAIAGWVNKHQPDVILSSEQMYYDGLPASVRRRPRGPAFVHLNIDDPSSPLAGIDQGHEVVGEHAVALLHLKLIQRESGVPERRDLLLIHGLWREGAGRWQLPNVRPPVAGLTG
jgi:LacI family transcriptional regulator